jgi:hypothetical protein
MSKHREEFVVSQPPETVAAFCRESIEAMAWRCLEQSESRIVCKEPFQFISFHWPAKIEVLLTLADDAATNTELRGSIFGFGPIQSRHLKGRMQELHDQIESRAAGVQA